MRKDEMRRVDLINKKYAGGGLSPEESAELRAINRLLDGEQPRFNQQDWGLLDEAAHLIKQQFTARPR